MELHDEGLEYMFTTFSPQETEALGKAMGSQLVSGDVVALIGELGSGKTCLPGVWQPEWELTGLFRS